jgi:hypothetical protein
MRISIKLAENSFISATFLMDTGCCSHLMVSPILMALIKPRLIKNEVGNDHIVTQVNNKSVICVVSPMEDERHQPANLIGLPLFFLMGIQFTEQKVSSFEYDKDDIAHEVVTQSLLYL